VEGEFDMITPYMHGIEHIVAIKGSAFTIEQLKIVKRYTHKLIFALDADEAGTQAIHKTIPLAQELEFEVYVCQIPGGKDPDEAVRHDLPAFRKALEKALPVYDYVIEMAGKYLKKEDPFTKKEFAKQTLPVLLAITNPIVKQHYLQKKLKKVYPLRLCRELYLFLQMFLHLYHRFQL
jgi:DNA primase